MKKKEVRSKKSGVRSPDIVYRVVLRLEGVERGGSTWAPLHEHVPHLMPYPYRAEAEAYFDDCAHALRKVLR